MSQYYAELVNNISPFNAIYFDLKAAFDKVDHPFLLTKIFNVGIHERIV